MATTSLSLGEHWEEFIKNERSSGRYSSASEVVRDALRAMEERKANWRPYALTSQKVPVKPGMASLWMTFRWVH